MKKKKDSIYIYVLLILVLVVTIFISAKLSETFEAIPIVWIFFALLFLVYRGFNKLSEARDSGRLLSEDLKPYIDRIHSYAHPLSGTEFVKTMAPSAYKILTYLQSEYESYKRQNTLKENHVCKIVIEAGRNRCEKNEHITDAFALAFILSHKIPGVLVSRPSETEEAARKAVLDHCKKKLKWLCENEDVPDSLLQYFCINRSSL